MWISIFAEEMSLENKQIGKSGDCRQETNPQPDVEQKRIKYFVKAHYSM